MSSTRFLANWRRAPWLLKAYALFALGITLFEVGVLFWDTSPQADTPYFELLPGLGYLLTLPLVYFGVRERRPRFLIGIFAILAIHVLFTLARPVLGLELDAMAVVLAVGVPLLWMAVLASSGVRRYFSNDPAQLEG